MVKIWAGLEVLNILLLNYILITQITVNFVFWRKSSKNNIPQLYNLPDMKVRMKASWKGVFANDAKMKPPPVSMPDTMMTTPMPKRRPTKLAKGPISVMWTFWKQTKCQGVTKFPVVSSRSSVNFYVHLMFVCSYRSTCFDSQELGRWQKCPQLKVASILVAGKRDPLNDTLSWHNIALKIFASFCWRVTLLLFSCCGIWWRLLLRKLM